MKQTKKKMVWLVAFLGVGTLAGSVGICAEQRSLVHGARKRTYLIHLPVGRDKLTPTALVFCLHSYGGTGREIEKRSGLSLLADREGFIAVYPNAVAFGPMGLSGVEVE